MSEAKENLERLRARRGGHRGVCTKLQREADELVLLNSDENDDNVNRCEIVQGMLEEKRKLLEKIDEEILALCDVKDIPVDIEESAEVVSRILKATTKLARYRRKESKKTTQAVSEETITIQDGVNAQVTNDLVESSSENNVSDSPTLVEYERERQQQWKCEHHGGCNELSGVMQTKVAQVIVSKIQGRDYQVEHVLGQL